MSDSEKRLLGLLLKQLIAIITLTIFLAPATAFADPFLILRNEVGISTIETGKQTNKSSVTVGLNEKGDLMIRHSDVSLIVAYNQPNDIVDSQERIRIAQRQDSPFAGGISLTVSIFF